MKVKCIKDIWVSPFSNDSNGPKNGDIDEVMGEDNRFGYLAYSLERFGPTQFFRASYFIPLSDFTIEELIGERELQEA